MNPIIKEVFGRTLPSDELGTVSMFSILTGFKGLWTRKIIFLTQALLKPQSSYRSFASNHFRWILMGINLCLCLVKRQGADLGFLSFAKKEQFYIHTYYNILFWNTKTWKSLPCINHCEKYQKVQAPFSKSHSNLVNVERWKKRNRIKTLKNH